MALCSQYKEQINKELGIPRAADIAYEHHGTWTPKSLGPFKIAPLRTQTLTLCGAAKRAVFLLSRFRFGIASVFTAPQEHDVQQFPQPWCFPH